MIAFLKGVLVELESSYLVLEVSGVGYEIAMNTSNCGFQIGEICKIYTEAIYREDSRQLYGFKDPTQRNFFRLLISKVSGIGPKLAMTILNSFTMSQLYQIILTGDAARLSQCQGVGKKTAQRLILDLRDHLQKQSVETSLKGIEPTRIRDYEDIVGALIGLGYSRRQAELLFEGIAPQLDDKDSTEIIIKKILAQKNKQ